MEIRSISVDELHEAEYNPRLKLRPGMEAYERLRRSLDEFGLVQPIVWNERTGRVVGGHQRLTILKDQGKEMVDVAVVSLDESREKALNVLLNNPKVGGDWDAEKLMDVMEELRELPDFDETLTGFNDEELRDLLLAPDLSAAFQEECDPQDDLVRVTLEVESSCWEAVRPQVDQLVKQHGLRAHVKIAGE